MIGKYGAGVSESLNDQMEAELRRNLEAQQEHVLTQQHLRELMQRQNTPFEETEEFRDFVVWLCGFTEHHEPPSAKEWEGLRERAKKVAAKFALAARDKARERSSRPKQTDLPFTYPGLGVVPLSTTGGIAGAYTKTTLDSSAYDTAAAGTNVKYSAK